jgi:hypothetical protein
MAQVRSTIALPGAALLAGALLLDLALYGLALAQAVPPLNQCRRNWVLTEITPMDFGAFSIESGSGTITMDRFGALTASGAISLSASQPVTAYTITADNTLSASCAIYGFDLYWLRVPGSLRGPGTDIPQSNVLVTVPAYGLNDASLPQTIAPNAGNSAPFSITVYSTISPTAPQTAGAYQSQSHVLALQQSNQRARASSRTVASVFAPLTITESVAMDFGVVAGGQTSGTVVLDTGGGRIATGGAQTLVTGPGTAASFQISGEPNLSYTLSFGNGVLANAGGQQITLTNFTDNSSGTLPAAGTDTFQVGATLNLGANQQAGAYSTANGGGSPYSVTISYN